MKTSVTGKCIVNHEEVQAALKKLETMPNCKELTTILAYIVSKLDKQ